MSISTLQLETANDLLYTAWTIIANANEGNWDKALPEWKQAAEKWRDSWHAYLLNYKPLSEEEDGLESSASDTDD